MATNCCMRKNKDESKNIEIITNQKYMEKEKKMKVAMICHFSNEMVRDKLIFSKGHVKALLKRFISKKQNFVGSGDFAPWVTNVIKEFDKRREIDFYIISPHVGMKKKQQTFILSNVTYYFFRPFLLFPLNYIEKLLYPKQYKEFPRNRRIVNSIVESLSPDVVLLCGSENPYYSITVLDIKKIPILLLCQTVYSNPNRKGITSDNKSLFELRWNVEQQIYRKIKYYACFSKLHHDLVKKYVPNSIVFPLVWPQSSFPDIPEVQKKYDFAFFAQRVTKDKGIYNALQALSIVKRQKSDVSLLVVGIIPNDEKLLFEDTVKKLKLDNNIIYHDYFPIQTDMFKYVKQASFALLPIILDSVPGTIIQSFRLGMPVVTHITSGTPSLNEFGETVLLSNIDDDETTAKNMLRLLNDPELGERLKMNANRYIEFLDEKHKKGADVLINSINAIINKECNNIEIPQELLFGSNI